MLMMAVLTVVSCNNTPKQAMDNGSLAPDNNVTVEETTPEVEEQELVDLSGCDMAVLGSGKLFFYDSKTSTAIPYMAETDSVVNCVFTQDDYLYYCVPVKGRMMLRRINLTETNPQPEQMADWGVDYEKCVTETYGTVFPLEYYASRNMLGLYHEFSWDSYSLDKERLYNMDNGQVTDWDYETWQQGEPVLISDDEEQIGENYQYESVGDEFKEY